MTGGLKWVTSSARACFANDGEDSSLILVHFEGTSPNRWLARSGLVERTWAMPIRQMVLAQSPKSDDLKGWFAMGSILLVLKIS